MALASISSPPRIPQRPSPRRKPTPELITPIAERPLVPLGTAWFAVGDWDQAQIAEWLGNAQAERVRMSLVWAGLCGRWDDVHWKVP